MVSQELAFHIHLLSMLLSPFIILNQLAHLHSLIRFVVNIQAIFTISWVVPNYAELVSRGG